MSRSVTRRSPGRQDRRTAATTTRPRWRSRLLLAAAVAVVLAAAVIGITAGRSQPPTSGGSAAGPATGQRVAPDGTFTTVTGRQLRVASFRGHPTLLWFVATWCSSCQAGTQAVAANLAQLRAHGVRVVELELYRDLGQPGPDIAAFGRAYAGAAYGDADWTWGTASARLSYAYDPNGYLDVYYLVDAQGRIAYVNGSPAATISDLLAHTAKLA